jgi:CDP-paratose 2-epimerase
MKIILTGACGFVGRTLVAELRAGSENISIVGVDNLLRAGSETNRSALEKLGVQLLHLDIRSATDIETLPAADFVIDAAANPSVLAGIDGRTNSRQLMEHNLLGTINLLEYCKRHRAGFSLLSTSRVYSIAALAALPMEVRDGAYHLKAEAENATVSRLGITEEFSTQPPLSLYGAAKLSSEYLALEYGDAFGFPVWINRCGVLAGAGQFGRADQGIFSFWIHSYRARRPLSYIGFGGEGHQVRDCLHPRDLVPALKAQMGAGAGGEVIHFGGGSENAMSLRQLSDWCSDRFGPHPIQSEPTERPFDLPWLVLDSRRGSERWDWRPQTSAQKILEEIATHAEVCPNWLDLTG